MSEETVLVIGYYDRKNIGDEAYKLALPLVLKTIKSIRFVCSDDIDKIPDDVTTVICGGGDIINDYFMKKIQDLLKSFTGRVYAVSVGIPYTDAVKYLHVFDHIFARSSTDYQIACQEVGEDNVSICQDITACIPVKVAIRKFHRKIRVGLCLAQPYFYANPYKQRLIDSLANVLARLYYERVDIEYHFLTFNYDDTHQECDKIINASLAEQLSHLHVPYSVHDNIITPMDMLTFFNLLDVTLCMRYHSVMFSAITNTRFVPLYISSKIKNLLGELNYDAKYCVEMAHDTSYKPISINQSQLYHALTFACDNVSYSSPLVRNAFDEIFNKIVREKKYVHLLITDKLRSFEDVLISIRRALIKYLHLDPTSFDDVLTTKAPLPIGDKEALDVARFICFIISGKTHHPCVWGLASKLTEQDFVLYDSIKYIWDTCRVSHEQCENSHSYYPRLATFNRRALINLDYVFQSDFSQFHRSGWSYVTGGLMNLDATHIMRKSDVLLDTYVDRTFHWGYPIVKYLNMVPYVKPWYGFVHHTFNTEHSEFNCFKLLANGDFIESLKCCKGLLCLSQYLANQFKVELDKLQITVPIYTLYHPMEFVDKVFTMNNFITNKNRKVVQIGAWLRNPYSIYELPLPSNGGPLKLTKVALKGKEMDQYFPPPGFDVCLKDVLIDHDWFAKPSDDPCCRDNICRDNICRDTMCRPGNSSINKYCKGLYDHIIKQLNSVVILDKLSNEDYDTLLSENIVFLNLVDCSAVNTVVEGIVRNTPIIVNKLPPLIEILGPKYPGFYDSIEEAEDICSDMANIRQIYNYLAKLDKERYRLENFIDEIQNIINDGDNEVLHDLFQKPASTLNVFSNKYIGLQRYLPQKFYKELYV